MIIQIKPDPESFGVTAYTHIIRINNWQNYLPVSFNSNEHDIKNIYDMYENPGMAVLYLKPDIKLPFPNWGPSYLIAKQLITNKRKIDGIFNINKLYNSDEELLSEVGKYLK